MPLLCGEPGKSKSHLLTPPIVCPCRLLSGARHNQPATRVPRACLGFGRALPCTCLLMHELGMFDSKELTGRQGKGGGREGSHCQALFMRLLWRSQAAVMPWRQRRHWQSPPACYQIGNFNRCGQLIVAHESHLIFLFILTHGFDL